MSRTRQSKDPVRACLLWGGGHGLASVAMGAFGAHGLKKVLSPEALAWVETGARYEMIGALALLALAALHRQRESRTWPGEVWAFGFGAAIFSGSLYLMALTNWRWLGAVTPVGGLFMMAGFFLIILDAIRPKISKT